MNPKGLITGDVVWHILYGREWLALLRELELNKTVRESRALVYMIPGTEYQHHFNKFSSRLRESEKSGWIYLHWLRRAERIIN